jgi:transcriptional regulator with XRE-family HTH domain
VSNNNIFKTLRVNKGWSQGHLARKLGIHQNAISHWESGRSMPGRDMLQKISQIYDVTVDKLLACEDKPEKEDIPAIVEKITQDLENIFNDADSISLDEIAEMWIDLPQESKRRLLIALLVEYHTL